MKFLGGYRTAFVTFAVIALSVYIALYGFKFDNSILRIFCLKKDSPGNETGGKVAEKSPFDDDFGNMYTYMSIAEDSYSQSLHYDYYRDSCPSAERIIAKSIREIYGSRPSVAPSLIRLLFHDCFIEGCDASVLLDADESFPSEKEAPPNQSLKGLDMIDAIKSELENVCPGVVSCADIVVLAARESVLVAGGPFYPLATGRRDSEVPFKEMAERDLPSPQANLTEILSRFRTRGFNERETVSLFGAHSIGITHCTFFQDRLYNFTGTGKPDPELNREFLKELKTKCPFSVSASSPSPSPSHGTGLAPSSPVLPASDYSTNNDVSSSSSSGNRNDGVVDLSYNNEGGDENFGTRYFRRLLQKKGLMFSDQQLTGSEETLKWVRAYASDPVLFRRDFATSMMKLSNFQVLTGPLGQVRTTCSKALPVN